jgi:hypothetical protein
MRREPGSRICRESSFGARLRNSQLLNGRRTEYWITGLQCGHSGLRWRHNAGTLRRGYDVRRFYDIPSFTLTIVIEPHTTLTDGRIRTLRLLRDEQSRRGCFEDRLWFSTEFGGSVDLPLPNRKRWGDAPTNVALPSRSVIRRSTRSGRLASLTHLKQRDIVA